MLHDLKIWPGPLRSIRAGAKRYEVRKEDTTRFHVGDRLVLKEWVEKPGCSYYTGEVLVVRVTHITRGGEPPSPLPQGVAVLGIEIMRS